MEEKYLIAKAPPLEAFPRTVETHQISRYTFTLQNWKFLLPVSTLAELIIDPDIYPLPFSSNYLKGLCNVRGNIIPIYAPFSSKKKQILYFSGNEGFSLVVDELKLEYFPDNALMSEIPSFAPELLKPFVIEVLKKENEVYFECDWISWIEKQL